MAIEPEVMDPQEDETAPPEDSAAVVKANKFAAAIGYDNAGAGVQLRNLQDLFAFAAAMVHGGMAPKGMKSTQAAAAIAIGGSFGVNPVLAMCNVSVTNGRARMMGDLALGVIERAGLLRPPGSLVTSFSGEPMSDEWTCTIRARRADSGREVESSFSVADAKTAKLWGRTAQGGPMPWTTSPKRMLYYRALGFLLRDLFADVLMGLYTREELAGTGMLTALEEDKVAAHVAALEASGEKIPGIIEDDAFADEAEAAPSEPDPFFAVPAREPEPKPAEVTPETREKPAKSAKPSSGRLFK